MQETAQTQSLAVDLNNDPLGGLFYTKNLKKIAKSPSNK